MYVGSYFQVHGWDIAVCPKVEMSLPCQDRGSSFNSSYNIEPPAEVEMRCQSQRDGLFTLCCSAAATVTGIIGAPQSVCQGPNEKAG